jgi:hypothetical protein
MVSDDTGWGADDRERAGGRQSDDRERAGGPDDRDDRRRADDRRRRPRRGDDRRGPQSRRSALDSLLDGSSTWVNALLGGIAGIVFSFVPFSTVLGGVLAGYLEAGPGGESPGASTSDGLSVGGIAGAIMFVPFLLFAYIAFAIVAASGSTTFGGIVLFVFLTAALYTIGAGMLGGVLGVIVRDEVDNRPESRRGW